MFLLFYRSETQDLSKVQATFFSQPRVLSEMSASGLESGIVDESRLFVGDDFAFIWDTFSLALVLFWILLAVSSLYFG